MGAPAVAGQVTAADFSSASRARSNSVGTFTSPAYQFQPPPSLPSGSNTSFDSTPCRLGFTPVIMVVCAGKVIDGVTLVAPRAQAPSRTSARRLGTARPSLSGVR